MEKLRASKKITLATLKSFAKRNANKIYFKSVSDFDGMVDCVTENRDAKWIKSEIIEDTNYYKTGILGIYTVGQSRDYFNLYEDAEYFGIEVYNSCGSSIIAIKKF